MATDQWGSTGGDWGNVQQIGQGFYNNIGNQANNLMNSVVQNNPWSQNGTGWGQYPDVRNPNTQSHLNTFMDYTMAGQRNQADEYVRRAGAQGVTRGGQNVQGGPAYQTGLHQQAMSGLAGGYEGRFQEAMKYLADQYTAQNKAWTDAAQIGTQLYGIQQQGLNTMAGDIASARNYASTLAGQGSAERIAGIESQTALGTADIQKQWQEYAAQKQLEAAIQQAGASKYGADQNLAGTMAEQLGAGQRAEIESEWQKYAAQRAIDAAAAAKSGITPEQTSQIGQLWAQLQELAPAYTLHGQHLAAEPTSPVGLNPGQIVVSNPQSGQRYAYDPQAYSDTSLAQLPSWTGYEYQEGELVTGLGGDGKYQMQPIYYTDKSTGAKSLVGYQEHYNWVPTGKYGKDATHPPSYNGSSFELSFTNIPGSSLQETGYDDAFLNWNNSATNVFGTAPQDDPFFSMYYMNPEQVSQWNALLGQIGNMGGSTTGYSQISDYAVNPMADYYTVGTGGALTPYGYQLKNYDPTTNAWG